MMRRTVVAVVGCVRNPQQLAAAFRSSTND
jgi:hypothetical protein